MRFTKYIPFACALVSAVYAAPMNAPQGSVSERSGHTDTVHPPEEVNVLIQWADALKAHGIIDITSLRSATEHPTPHNTPEHPSPHSTPEHPTQHSTPEQSHSTSEQSHSTSKESEELPAGFEEIEMEGATWMPGWVNRKEFAMHLPIVVNNVKATVMKFAARELGIRPDPNVRFFWDGCPTLNPREPLEYAVVAEFGTYKVLQSHNVYDDAAPYVVITEYSTKKVIKKSGNPIEHPVMPMKNPGRFFPGPA
ncbi:hypothetical protein C8R42DRAFT_685656 [Lentinula raphanica]|nr:hypothetical protein C8R42DRAFT_685656 [Lentinula raphanica]